MSLVDGEIKRQYKIKLLNNFIGYIDLIYFKQQEIIIVELKKETIVKQDIIQLSEYVHQIKKENPDKKIHGFLVGKNIPEDFKILLKLRGFEFKQLRKEIPLRLKLCDICRKALNIRDKKCKWCNSEKFITI